MSNYLISLRPASALVGRVSFSHSDQVDRKILASQWQDQPKPVTLESIHLIISSHVNSSGQDIVVAMHPAIASAEVRDFCNNAHILEDFDTHCDTFALCSHLKRGNDHLRSFTIEEELPNDISNVLTCGPETDDWDDKNVFLASPKDTVFINNYAGKKAPIRNTSKIFDGDIGGDPLSGLEIFSALAYSLGYLKSGPELKERAKTSDPPRQELRVFSADLYTLQAMLDLQRNAPKLDQQTLFHYSDPFGQNVSSAEHVRTLLGTQLMPRMERELEAAFKLLNPSDIKYLNKEEIVRYKIFMETRMVPV